MGVHRIILCPGQGAQAVGMGKAWHAASAEARTIFDRADHLLGKGLGGGGGGAGGAAPLSQVCFAGPAERLNRTDVSQPAIYVTSVACWRAMLSGWGLPPDATAQQAGIAATAGLSLGEYTALHIAGAFSFEEGLELVALRGRAMQDAAESVPGGSGMVALIGADEPQAQAVCEQALRSGMQDAAGAEEVLVPANFNAPGQVVISGSAAACARAVGIAAAMGLRAAPLPVAGAFHSPLMAHAADRLAAALAKARITQPACTVISNVTGAAHVPEPGATIAQTIRRRLIEQLTMPVRWAQGCAPLLALAGGGGLGGGVEFHELAPGKTLSGLMRRIERSVRVETHDEPTVQHTA